MLVQLKKPLIVGDKTLDAIDMNLDALTGADIAFCTRETEANTGMKVRVIVTDQDLHVEIAAKASGVAVADLMRLGARDYVEVVTAVQGFLTGSV
jgi:hypothetical protein